MLSHPCVLVVLTALLALKVPDFSFKHAFELLGNTINELRCICFCPLTFFIFGSMVMLYFAQTVRLLTRTPVKHVVNNQLLFFLKINTKRCNCCTLGQAQLNMGLQYQRPIPCLCHGSAFMWKKFLILTLTVNCTLSVPLQEASGPSKAMNLLSCFACFCLARMALEARYGGCLWASQQCNGPCTGIGQMSFKNAQLIFACSPLAVYRIKM